VRRRILHVDADAVAVVAVIEAFVPAAVRRDVARLALDAAAEGRAGLVGVAVVRMDEAALRIDPAGLLAEPVDTDPVTRTVGVRLAGLLRRADAAVALLGRLAILVPGAGRRLAAARTAAPAGPTTGAAAAAGRVVRAVVAAAARRERRHRCDQERHQRQHPHP